MGCVSSPAFASTYAQRRIRRADAPRVARLPAEPLPALPDAGVVASASPSADGCAATDLTASRQLVATRDAVSGVLLFTNQASSSCRLAGSPRVSVADARGNEILTVQKANGIASLTLVQPKGTASVDVSWVSFCGRAPSSGWMLKADFPGWPGYLLVLLQTSLGRSIASTPPRVDAHSEAVMNVGAFGG